MQLNRRQFLKWSTIASAATALCGGTYATFIEPFTLRTKSYRLKNRKWPVSYPSLKIGAVGDLHVGCPSVNLDRLDNIVTAINAMAPDIIFLLGDYLVSGVIGGKYVDPGDIAASLGKLTAPHGVYAVLGNHDWYEDGTGMWDALTRQGITVLENNAVALTLPGNHKVWIAGLADDTTRIPDLNKTLSVIKDESPVIMLSHDPATFMDMTDRPVITLCGHTHGGQMAMPFFGAIVIPGRAPLRYAYGHIVETHREMIVTSGVGTSILPIRAFAVPEILEITLESDLRG